MGGKWTPEEDADLRCIVEQHGAKNWKRISALLGPTRTDVQCLHRWNKVLRPGLHKGSWSEAEDAIVREMVAQNVGSVKWSTIAARLPGRIGKQCRERWFNHLDPTIKRGDWDNDEDRILYEAQRNFGNRWCEISKILPGRTENAVKNRWNSSTMRRWLTERDLIPGNGQPIVDLSLPGGVEHALASFKSALELAGVKGADAMAALMAPDGIDNDEYDGKSRSTKRGTSSKSCRGKGGRGGVRGGRAVGAALSASNNSRSQSRTIRKRGDENHVISMLGHLKSVPGENNRGHGRNSIGLSGRGRRGRGSRSMYEDDEDVDEDEHYDDLDENGDFGQLGDQDLDDETPTSQALKRLYTSLQYQIDSDDVPCEGDQIPLSILPHFNKLNESGQKSLMRQLIERVQRTNTTPRNIVLTNSRGNSEVEPISTDPDFMAMGMGVLQGSLGLDSPRFAALGDAQDWESNVFDEGNSIPLSWGLTETPMTMHAPSSVRSTRSTRSTRQNAIQAASGVFSDGEMSPLDIAVLVAFNVVIASKNSVQIMRTLLGENTTDNQSAPTLNAAMAPPVGILNRRNSINRDNVEFDSGSNTTSTATANSLEVGGKPSAMSKLPAHLRPPLIDTDRKTIAGSTTEKLVEMLGNLKETSSPLVQAIAYVEARKESNPQESHSKGSTSELDDSSEAMTRVTRSKGQKRKFGKLAEEPDSTSLALQRLHTLLQQRLDDDPTLMTEDSKNAGESDQLPMSMLRYFCMLNGKGHRYA